MSRLWSKAMTNLDIVLKSRDITLPAKVHLFKGMVFPVVMYGCELGYKERWTLKNWCFWTVGLKKILASALNFKEIQQVHPKENQSEYSLEGLMLKLKLQTLAAWCKELTHLKRPWCWERLKAQGEGEDRGQDGWMASSNQQTWVWANSRRWWQTGRPGVL